MKGKKITIDNYQEFLPSELVRSFVWDLEQAAKIGKKMDMYSWYPTVDCLPCLGGMACMNLGVSPRLSNVGREIALMGDSIRLAQPIGYNLQSLYPTRNIKKFEIVGKRFICDFDPTNQRQVAALTKQINAYADALEKQGN